MLQDNVNIPHQLRTKVFRCIKNAGATVDRNVQQKVWNAWYELLVKKNLCEGKIIKQNGVCKTNGWIERVMLSLGS